MTRAELFLEERRVAGVAEAPPVRGFRFQSNERSTVASCELKPQIIFRVDSESDNRDYEERRIWRLLMRMIFSKVRFLGKRHYEVLNVLLYGGASR